MKTKIAVLILWVLISIFLTAKNDRGSTIEELENQLKSLSGKEKIQMLLRLAGVTYTRSPKKCVDYCKQILDSTGPSDDPKARANASIYLNYAYDVLGDREKSLKYSKQALALFEKLKDKNGIYRALNAIGSNYLTMDYPNMALDYYLKALAAYKSVEREKKKLYPSLMNIGHVYFKVENYQKALEYYLEALDIAKKNNDSRAMPLLYAGLCFHRKGNYKKSLEYLLPSLKLFENSGNKFYIAALRTNTGRVYIDMHKPALALTYLTSAKHVMEEIGDKSELFFTLYYLGDAYLEMKDYPNALLNYEGALKLAREQEDKSNLEKVFKSYSNLYAVTGDYKNAYEYYKRYSETREFLVNEKKNKQFAELEVQFEAENRANEIELLKKDNKIQVITRNAFITGFVLVSIILGLLFKKYLYLFAFWKRQKYIGQYRVIETIGTGGMGTVYLAHTLRDKKQLSAIKVLREEFSDDESSRQRFKHEGTIIDKVNHPNIVKIIERGDYKGRLYIAMEYLRGKTLSQKIKEEGKIKLKECLHIMKQVSDALAFIHGKNILHRDLKPANILLIEKDGETGTVKLLDFGVALTQSQTRLTQSGILVGTISYIAPEQITENLYSPAGDVYALGIIFYEMLIGKTPFHHDSITALVEKILDEAPEPPDRLAPDIPDELNRLIMRLLSKDPARRPTAAEVFIDLNRMC